MRLILIAAILIAFAGNVGATQREPFNARETVQRAGVGVYSPRLAPPVRVTVEPSPGDPARFRATPTRNRQHHQNRRQMECRPESPSGTLACVEVEPKK